MFDWSLSDHLQVIVQPICSFSFAKTRLISGVIGAEPINLHFSIPATDHLGKEEVQGQLRFHSEHIDLHWRVKGNVFTGGQGEMKLIEIPYSAVAEVSLKRKWFRPAELTLRLETPTLVAEIPGIEVGRLILLVDTKSKESVKKLHELIDYRRSIFLLDETNKRLEAMRN